MLEMEFQISLKIMASVQFVHTYYEDLQCRDFDIVPTAETANILKNHYLVAKTVNEKKFFGLVILYDPRRTPKLFSREDWLPEKLTFALLNNNPRFQNFTEMPFLTHKQGFYFNNAEVFKHSENGYRLHKEDLFKVSETSLINFTPKRFSHDFSIGGQAKDVSFGEIRIKDINGKEEELGAPKIYEISPTGGTSVKFASKDQAGSQAGLRHGIDLADYPEGRYGIYAAKGKELSAQVYALRQKPTNCIGVVELFFNGPATGDTRMVNPKAKDEKVITPKSFSVQFEARKTYWRYYFVNSRGEEVSDFEIKNKGKGGEIKFQKPIQTYLMDEVMSAGTPTTMLVSEKALALKEIQEARLELNLKLNGKGKTTITLPYPRVERVKAGGDDKKLYSDVFVYI